MRILAGLLLGLWVGHMIWYVEPNSETPWIWTQSDNEVRVIWHSRSMATITCETPITRVDTPVID